MGDQRLFVGNLPKDVSESTLENLFNKYQVSKIDIKRKKVLDDEAVFAFVNISSENVGKCLSELRNKKLNGCNLKIEPAKESFLERLKKEHHEKYQTNKKSNSQITTNSFQLRQDFNGVGVRNKKIKFGEDDFEDPSPVVENKKIKFSDNDFEDSSPVKNKKIKFNENTFEESSPVKNKKIKFPATEETTEDVPRKHNLPMFRGTASVLAVDTKSKSTAAKSKPSLENVNVRTLTLDANTAMRKFEEFSDVWKDDFTSSNYEYRKISFKRPEPKEEEEIKPLSFKSTSNKKNSERNFSEDETQEKTWFNNKHTERNFNSEEKNEKMWSNNKQTERNLNSEEKKEKPWPNNARTESKPINEKKRMTISWKATNREEEQYTEENSSYDQKAAKWTSASSEDDRFKMDEKFFDANDSTTLDEKRKRKKSATDSFENKIKNDDAAKEVFEHRQLIRYDPTRPDHKILEKKVRKTEPSIPDAKKKKTKKKESESEKKPEPVKPEVSKEKHYSVADTLKDAFKKSDNQPGFSLSSLFDQKIKEDPSSLANRSIASKKDTLVDDYHVEKIPQQYSDEESEEEVEMEAPIDIPSTSASEKILGKCGVWGETFFFKENDSRFKEAIDFFKPETENKETDFDRQRTKLKLIVRKKLQNSKKDNKLFKQKLGGKLNKSKFKMRLKKARNY